jgi:hypothetical protein
VIELGPDLQVDFGFVAVIAAFFFVLVTGLLGWTIYRLTGFRTRLRSELEKQGIIVHSIELRWLTRGPFPDMPIPGIARGKREYLFRVLAKERGGRPRSGWARWRVPLPWGRADQWALLWDENPDAALRNGGVSTLLYHGTLFVLIMATMYAIKVFIREG